MKKQETQKNAYNMLRVELGALATGMFYSSQLDRISAFNRIRQIVFRKIEGLDLTQKQEKKDKKDYEKKYTDAQIIKYLNDNLSKFSDEDRAYIEKIIVLLEDMRKNENNYKKLMSLYIENEPIYENWLKDVKGISTLNTANLLQYFGYCENAKHPSSLWKFAGLHVVDGHSPRKAKGEALDWNPKLRVLMFRIGDCFVKQRTPIYREIYDKEKEKQIKLMEKKTENAPKRLLHADLRARRKMIKAFLQHYWLHCCKATGRDPGTPYSHKFHKGEKPKW